MDPETRDLGKGSQSKNKRGNGDSNVQWLSYQRAEMHQEVPMWLTEQQGRAIKVKGKAKVWGRMKGKIRVQVESKGTYLEEKDAESG